MTVSDKIAKVYDALTNRINASINTHNSDSSAHSTEMAKKVDKAQGSSNASKNVVTDSSGNITTESKITKVSDLSNDAGYLTEHQDISDKLEVEDLNNITNLSYDENTGVLSITFINSNE